MAAIACSTSLAGGRQVPEQNLHLTLVFVGNVASADQACLEAGASAIHPPPRFSLRFDRIGSFPRARVIWLGASEVPAGLLRLQAAVAEAVGACGLDVDPRPYAPHVTLRRRIRRPHSASLEPVIGWQADCFWLVESPPPGSGGYRLLRRFELAPAPSP
jgi:2'-5' RNA ligase